MTKKIDKRLLCSSVAESEPHVQTEIDNCCECGRAVWRSLSSPVKPQAICNQCFMKHRKAGDHMPMLPLTKRQVRDIQKWRDRERGN